MDHKGAGRSRSGRTEPYAADRAGPPGDHGTRDLFYSSERLPAVGEGSPAAQLDKNCNQHALTLELLQAISANFDLLAWNEISRQRPSRSRRAGLCAGLWLPG